jgi:peptidoglycan/LPS O-acetylase OafA/YrhL
LLVDFERRVGGDYSYGLYIYGYPSQQLLAHFSVNHAGFSAYLLASYALALGCAILSWHFIEQPALSLRALFWKPRDVAVRVPA